MAEWAALLDASASGRSRPIWIDSLAYCRARLLGGAPLPWAEPGELAAFFGKANGMFSPDAALLDLADLYEQRIAGDEELRAKAGSRSRIGWPLRTLLGDESARVVAADAVAAVAAGSGSGPLVVSIPSPARWLAIAAAQAGQPPHTVDADRADTASLYVADFLRTFAGNGVSGLILDEGPLVVDELIAAAAYQSVFNVAENYGWPVIILTSQCPAWPHGVVAGVAGWLGSSAPAAAAPWGIVTGIPSRNGELGDSAADAAVVVSRIPPDADPDDVMTRVRLLQ